FFKIAPNKQPCRINRLRRKGRVLLVLRVLNVQSCLEEGIPCFPKPVQMTARKIFFDHLQYSKCLKATDLFGFKNENRILICSKLFYISQKLLGNR
ncbi:MAG: hypothetical protein DRH32_00955, partial [Deltaproteobacteria bacterium]